MKICQPVEKEQGIDNVLHGHFRSAPRYVVFDTDTNQATEVANAVRLQKKGRRTEYDICQPLSSMTNLSVDAAVVGGVGRCDLIKLQRCGIKVFKANSQVLSGNIDALVNGELTELTKSNTRRGYPC